MLSGASAVEESPYARAAPELIQLGYHPLPIEPATKRPGEFKGGRWWPMKEWQRFRDRTPSDFERGLWARNYPDANVGVVLGSPAGHGLYLIAVDIDIEDPDEADELVRQLPRSPMVKRGKKGQTRFYRAAKTVRSHPYNRAADRKRLVDILTGFDTRQTVVPPSVHPETGSAYVWLAGPVAAVDLPVFDADALTKLEEALSVLGWNPAAERPIFTPAPRDPDAQPTIWREVNEAALASLDAWVPDLDLHDCRRARSGYEAVATWRPSATGRLLDQRKRNLSIQPTGIRDFGDQRAYTAIDLVMVAAGKEQAEATDWLRERLGLSSAEIVYLPATQAPPAAPAVSQPAIPLPSSRADMDELPDALTHVPGLLGELTDWIVATARRPQRGLALGAALTVLGTAAGRKYAGPTRSATHLYVLGIARTSAGKDHALEQIARVMKSVGMQQHIGPSHFMSLSALVNRIIRQPLTLCAIDELGAFLTRINDRKARGDEKQISAVLREAWGKSFNSMNMPAWADREPDPVDSPAFSIYGVSAPDEFYRGLSGADISNGFLNRFLLISTRKKPSEREPKMGPFEVPSTIRHGLHLLYGSGSALVQATAAQNDTSGPMITAVWESDDAEWVYRQLTDALERRESEMDFLGRTAEIALRLAAIRAIGVRYDAPRITVADMEWGRDLALWSAERMIAETSDYMADTQNQAEAQRIVRLLRDSGEMQHGALVHAMRHRVKARELKELIDGLAEAGQVIKRKGDPPATGGPTPLFYRLS